MAKLQWQGTQGFDSREAAVRAANKMAGHIDPERPNLRWIISDIAPVGGSMKLWNATHYVYRIDGKDIDSVPVTE